MKNINFFTKITMGFAIEVILFWSLWFVYGFFWVNHKDTISNILNIIILIGMIITIASAIIIFIIIIKESTIKIKLLPVIVFIVFIVIHIGMYLNFSNMGNTTGGYFSIVEKNISNGKYYFYIENSNNDELIKIECQKQDYEYLLVDKAISYSISYRWLSFNDDEGVLNGSVKDSKIISSP